jgi:chemotaxis protein CheD
MHTPVPKLSASAPPLSASSVQLAYVPPGRLLATNAPTPLTTIVSTGAVVCVWDPVSGVGGMAHFLLPESGSAPPAQRFGDVALRTLVEDLVKLGAPERRLRAKVYGGSAPPLATAGAHLGDHNIAKALSFLQARFVPVLEKDAGGDKARKIVFDPKLGTSEVSRVGLS